MEVLSHLTEVILAPLRWAILMATGSSILALPDGSNVTVLLGNGDGTFEAPVSYRTTY